MYDYHFIVNIEPADLKIQEELMELSTRCKTVKSQL